ncbi:glycosidase [Microlunatus endophyticus]|uniref:Glycosidase n=1 Tax=Microlunatus endophyticus TaxID=1716077 RepID=A0A917S7G3_9ACTN|nr:glycoside hydrolase family 13 protein [Microlunatus endophyticus]GGL62986.1 glycosidase [Microlunatus endophyticus]
MIEDSTAADWWRQAAVYQIYPRSFADGNGDGIGDLQGIISRIDYLVALGIDAVWLSPFYPSALADGGYDVDDYRDVDPRIGNLDDFDELAKRLHEARIKLIIDIVPNHSSNRHRYFLEALEAGRGSAARRRYIFRDGRGASGELPPSDWKSVFGGPAWTQVADGQWYLHLFAPEQPDWNWDHPDVHAEFQQTLEFWGDRGVDGFRIDVANMLAKKLPDELPDFATLTLEGQYAEGAHPIWDRDDVHDIYAEWRKIFNRYTPPLTAVAEAWVPAHRRVRYASPEGLGQAFNFDLLRANFDAPQFRAIISENLDLAARSGASSTWVLSNHDVIRHTTRYGLGPEDATGMFGPSVGQEWLKAGGPSDQEDRATGLAQARAATLVTLALPGSAYLYQGEELGLPEVAEIPVGRRQDPTFFRTDGEQIGRDGARVPLPWTADGPSYGFSSSTGSGHELTGSAPHLPQPEWFADFAVSVEDGDPSSTLELYRAALALRHRLQTDELIEWVDLGEPEVLAFRRPNGWLSVTNFGDTAVPLPEGELLIISSGDPSELGAYATAWLQQ